MSDLSTISAVASTAGVLLVAAVIGGTELVNRLFDRDYRGASKIGVAVVIGLIGGIVLFPELGLAVGIFTGIAIGLAGAGVVTTATRFGGNS